MSDANGRSDPTTERVRRWSTTAPALTGEFAADSARVTRFLSKGAELLSALPPKPDRSHEGQVTAEQIHSASRSVRSAFMASHCPAVYDDLTDTGQRFIRLAALMDLAAERYPGLVPMRKTLDAERERLQEHKEGHEIDQGIFIDAVLRDPRAGAHLVEAMLRPTPAALDLLPEYRRSGRVDLGRVTVERRGRAAHVTLCNTRFLNAEDDPTVADLETAVDLALLDDDAEVGVLRGGPVDHPRYAGRRVFSSGINLTHLFEGRISLVGFMLRRELGPMHKMLRGHTGSREKPWIGVVDAFAIGGGMQLLLLLDHVIAEKGAYFRLPALIEGIIPGSANLRLSRFAGARAARRVIYWGESITADEPDGQVFCDRVVDSEDIDAAVEATVEHLANPAVVSNRRVLLNSEEPLDRFRIYMAAYASEQARLMHSPAMVANLKKTWVERRARRSG